MKLFSKQFIGRTTWVVLALTAVSHIAAYVIRDSILEPYILALTGVLVFWIALRSLPAGLLVAFTEVFVGGHGHLLDVMAGGFSVSLRMVIFAAVMAAWGIGFLQKKHRPAFSRLRDAPWAVLLVAVLFASAVGLLNNDPIAVFDDMNSFIILLYLLPLISVHWTQMRKRRLLQTLFGSGIWLIFFTLLLSYLFTHVDGKTLHALYTFVRDARLAEITLQKAGDAGFVPSFMQFVLGEGGYWYRIFMQSQLYVAVLLLLMASGMFMSWRDQRFPDLGSAAAAGSIAAVLLSMSRSFILGSTVGLAVIIITAFFYGSHAVRNIVKRSVLFAALFGIGLSLAVFTVWLPIPAQPDISDAAFFETSGSGGERELAVSSRWQLLDPMMEQVYASPVIGSGFGAEVTFITDDPRVRSMIPGGEYTTYRFEWGYQDIWLKMGLFGLAAFAWYAAVMVVGIRFTMQQKGYAWVVLGLGGGLAALFVTHTFSPYLNHPIGIAYMLFVLPFVDFKGLKKRIASRRRERVQKQAIAQTSPVITASESD